MKTNPNEEFVTLLDVFAQDKRIEEPEETTKTPIVVKEEIEVDEIPEATCSNETEIVDRNLGETFLAKQFH